VLALLPTVAFAQQQQQPSVEWALETCQQDAQCRASFFLDDADADTGSGVSGSSEYTRVAFAHLYRQFANASAVPEFDAATNAPAVQLWLALMRRAHFCEANMLFVLGRGCVCAPHKHCGERSDIDFLFDFNSFTAVAVSAGVVGVVAWHFHRKRLEQLMSVVAELLQAARAPRMVAVRGSLMD
jgi:hypothetical protein